MTGNSLGDAPAPLVNIDVAMDAVVAELGAPSFGVLPIVTVADIEAKFAELDPRPIERDDPRLENLSQEWINLGFTCEGLAEKFPSAKSSKGDRSKATFGFACQCLKNGISEHVTASCLWFWTIGEHIHDQKYPKRALVRIIIRASAAVENFETDRDKGKILKTSANIRRAIAKMNYELSYDAFRDQEQITGLPGYTVLDDPAVIEMWFKIESRLHFRPSKDLFYPVVTNLARRNGFHPVRNYLDTLVWDETKQLDEWLITYGGVEATDYIKAVGAIMLIAAVRRIRQPGCKFDEMVVLKSAVQGTLKSTLLSTMAVYDDWFSDTLPLNIKGRETIELSRESGSSRRLSYLACEKPTWKASRPSCQDSTIAAVKPTVVSSLNAHANASSSARLTVRSIFATPQAIAGSGRSRSRR